MVIFKPRRSQSTLQENIDFCCRSYSAPCIVLGKPQSTDSVRKTDIVWLGSQEGLVTGLLYFPLTLQRLDSLFCACSHCFCIALPPSPLLHKSPSILWVSLCDCLYSSSPLMDAHMRACCSFTLCISYLCHCPDKVLTKATWGGKGLFQHMVPEYSLLG